MISASFGEILKTLFSVVFLLIILSYYVLIFVKKRIGPKDIEPKSITVIIPAHNEEDYIEESVDSVLAADFKGKKDIIVIDDGSVDGTSNILKKYKGIKGIKIIKTAHSGKSCSLNKAMKMAKGDLIAVVDGDSVIEKDSLNVLRELISEKGIAAATCPVRVRNRKRLICMWLHINEVYASLIRGLMAKVNANITTPGPLSVYRRSALLEVGGFSTDCLSEDADITIRLIRKGYRIGFSEKTTSSTNMPHKFKWVFLQRLRFARGFVKILKKHLSVSRSMIDMYTLPIFLFIYIQAIIMGSLTIHQIIRGYLDYYVAYGIYYGLPVYQFLFEWFSLIGFFKWGYNVFFGTAPLTVLSFVAIVSTLLSYPLMVAAIIKYDKKVDIFHVIPFIFMSPFFLCMTVIQMISIPEMFRKDQFNIWKKNE